MARDRGRFQKGEVLGNVTCKQRFWGSTLWLPREEFPAEGRAGAKALRALK